MTLQRKVRLMFLYMMLVCILFCFTLFYIILESRMETSSIEKDNNNRVAITNNYRIAMDNLNSISRLIMVNNHVTEFLTVDNVTATKVKKAVQGIYNILNTFDVNYSITVLRHDKQYINTGPGITYINKRVIFSDSWLTEVRAQEGKYILKSRNDAAFRSNTEEIITFTRIINDVNTQKEIGLLAINIPTSFFEQTYNGLIDSKSHVSFYDREGVVISCDDPDFFTHLDLTKDIPFGQTIAKGIINEQVSTYQWIPDNIILTTYSEVNLLEGLTGRLAWGLFGGVLILLIFMNQINSYLSKNVTKPIQKLVKSMAQVQKGWLHRVSMSVPDDEIGQLKNSYNEMLIEINQLIEELLQKEKNLQKAELNALQEQMKPHFLYNTLDTIRFLLLDGEHEKAYQMIETLGNFYQKFLSKGSIDIPITEEINIVRDYLMLQKNRYEDVFEDEYDIQEGLNLRVPRLILQPLVENSIYHGLRPKGEKGIIRLSAYQKDKILYIKIYDTGIGMTAEQIQMLFDGKNSNSFGFQGTMERIRYYYKTEDVFEIRSNEGEFCEVELKLPIEEASHVPGNDYRR